MTWRYIDAWPERVELPAHEEIEGQLSPATDMPATLAWAVEIPVYFRSQPASE
jgi:hypothetical protein